MPTTFYSRVRYCLICGLTYNCDRPDIDLLGFGLAEEPYLVDVFKELCRLETNDGITSRLWPVNRNPCVRV